MKIATKSIAMALLLSCSPIAIAQAQQGPAPQASEKARGAETPNRGEARSERAQQRSQSDANRQQNEGRAERGPDKAKQRSAQPQQQKQKQERRAQQQEKKQKSREASAERQEERQEKRSERRSERREERRENRADRREERREQRTERREERQENRAERREDKRERKAERKEERQDRKTEDRRSESRQQRDAATGNETPRNREARDERKARDGERREARKLNWSQEKRQRARQAFRQSRDKVRHHRDVDFRITIGRRLPRDWEYYAVPTVFIDFAPEYRDYRYAYVEDRYVIVDPDSYVVVAYIDDDTGEIYAVTDEGYGKCSDLQFTSVERRRILRDLNPRRYSDVSGISIGFSIPGGIELSTFPQPIYDNYDRLYGCRYVALSNDRVAVIAPDTRKVVAIITD